MSEKLTPMRPELDGHPRRDDLARLVRTVVLSAADEQRAGFADGLAELLEEIELAESDGQVGKSNVIAALAGSELPSVGCRTLLVELLMRALALSAPFGDSDAERLALQLSWLTAKSYLDPLGALDRCLPDEVTAPIWRALAGRVRAADSGPAGDGLGDALAAAVALAGSPQASAQAATEDLAGSLQSPLLRLAMRTDRSPAGSASATPIALEGEIITAPRGPIGFVLGALTGWLLLRQVFRLLARGLLRYRCPARLELTAAGLRVRWEHRLLGQRIRSAEAIWPHGGLMRAVHEVRYGRLTWYCGLFALAVGTFVGVRLAVDGAQVGSASLIAIGALLMGTGVLADFLASRLMPTVRGHHRLLFVPRRGRRLSVEVADPEAAEGLLRGLAKIDQKS